jgi:hypothetical protein
MYAANPAKSRTRKVRPLRDVSPPTRHAHQDSRIVMGDWNESPAFQDRLELLKTTIRKVVLRGGLFSLMPDGKPSALLNDLIEGATHDGLYLLRRQITANELLHSDMSDEAIELTFYPLPDRELIRRAKCIADKVVKSQKIISRRAKRDEAGNIIRDDKGRAKRGYKCVDLRIEHPVLQRDEDGKPTGAWTDHRDGQVSGIDGRPMNGGRSDSATNQQVANFQRQLLHEVLAKHLGQDDSEFLLEYLNGRFPESPETAEMAELLMLKLAPHADELEQFRDLLT